MSCWPFSNHVCRAGVGAPSFLSFHVTPPCSITSQQFVFLRSTRRSPIPFYCGLCVCACRLVMPVTLLLDADISCPAAPYSVPTAAEPPTSNCAYCDDAGTPLTHFSATQLCSNVPHSSCAQLRLTGRAVLSHCSNHGPCCVSLLLFMLSPD